MNGESNFKLDEIVDMTGPIRQDELKPLNENNLSKDVDEFLVENSSKQKNRKISEALQRSNESIS